MWVAEDWGASGSNVMSNSVFDGRLLVGGSTDTRILLKQGPVRGSNIG